MLHKISLATLTLALTLPLGLAQVGCGSPSSGSASSSAENSVSPAESLIEETTNETLDPQSADPTQIEGRIVKVRSSLLKEIAAKVAVGQSDLINAKLNVDLERGRTEQILLDQAEKVSAENIVFTGKMAGDFDSSVTIVLNDGVVAATFRGGDDAGSYEIRALENGKQALIMKQDEDDSNCEEIPGDTDETDGTGATDGATAINEEDTAMATTPVIDILGAYTPKARAQKGGKSAIVALIQLGVADTNRAFADSGINLKARLVGTMEVKSNETGNWSSDLSRLASKTDGKWDEVHAERARLGADQVSLVGVYSGSGTAGIGYIKAASSKAFTIVKTSAFGQYTFAHELGHNLGLNHSDGFVNYSGRFRTIMAYGSYTRIRRYSNPSLRYNGYVTGDNSHNESRILKSTTASRVAAYSASKIYSATEEEDSAAAADTSATTADSENRE